MWPRQIKCNVRTVSRLRQCYREIGRTADRPRSGCPRVTTPAQDRYIRTSRLRDRYRIATTTSRVTPGTHNQCPDCPQQAERGWTDGLQACCKAGPHQTSPATTSPMGTNPPSLVQTGLVNVLFTDESRVCLTRGDGRIRVYCRRNFLFLFFISPLFNQVGKLRTSSHLQLRPGQDKAQQCEQTTQSYTWRKQLTSQ